MNDKKILIVEDDISLSDPLRILLTKEGFNVETAKNGEEGLSKGEAFIPDLIILDILMLKMDGLVMLEMLRTSDWGKSIPVMILSNVDDKEVQKAAEMLGISAFVLKADVGLYDVVGKIKEILKV